MLNLTKEQIKESLIRLQEYSRWMYFSENSAEMLEKRVLVHENHSYRIKVRQDGLIDIKLENGVIGVFDFQIVRGSPSQFSQIENMVYQTKLLKLENCEPEKQIEYEEYFGKIRIQLASFLQRQVAFTFLARMAPESMDNIVDALVSCNQ